ncbi:class III signal peptide-containing protein [Methanopyrus sp.]
MLGTRGQGGVEYLLILTVIIGLAAVAAYYVITSYHQAGKPIPSEAEKAATKASQGTQAWDRFNPNG